LYIIIVILIKKATRLLTGSEEERAAVREANLETGKKGVYLAENKVTLARVIRVYFPLPLLHIVS